MEFWPREKKRPKHNILEKIVHNRYAVAREHLHHQYHLIEFENGHLCMMNERVCVWARLCASVCDIVSAARVHACAHASVQQLFSLLFYLSTILFSIFFFSLSFRLSVVVDILLSIGHCLQMEKEI